MRSDEDRTTAARIRDAAVVEFSTNGVAGTSVRTIAAAAGVSPGLVIHHFGSKEGLRTACDEHVAAVIREAKTDVVARSSGFDVTAAFRKVGALPAGKYLARTLLDGSPHVAELIDELVADAAEYLAVGVESGLLKPSRHDKERAAILTIWALGGLLLSEHLQRLIGVDITADFSRHPEAAARYFEPVIELYSQGLFTEVMTDGMREAFEATHTSEGDAP